MTAVFALALTLATAGQDNPVAAARDLYASAAYEDALVVLERTSNVKRSADDARAIAQYRAFCLLALGRTTDAERAIEAVIASEPMYRPAASDVSPRVRAAFTEVRRRTLPAIIQQKYAEAKAAYDRKDFSAAAAAFTQLLLVMDDVDVAQAASQPPLADLRTLAAGFRDLATTAATPPPLPAAPVPLMISPPAPKPLRVYTASDPDAVPPLVVRQELPTFPGEVLSVRQGTLEVVIDETGAVESAMIRQSVSKQYDALALAATRTWRYRPATVSGVPVKFRKSIQISVKPKTAERGQ